MNSIKFNNLEKINSTHHASLKNQFKMFLDSGWYINGPSVTLFEKKFASYCGTKHCLGVGNGLDALKIILRGYIELKRLAIGDEILVPANTYIASILAITEAGLKPILIEPDSKTYNLDSSLIKEHINSKTKAILAVHLYGRLANMKALKVIAEKNNLLLFEDASQAHGAETDSGLRAGNLSDAAGFSFYPTKNLGALGDGGAITTNDSDFYQVVRKIANYGTESKDVNIVKGLNSRLDEIQAAFLKIKLEFLDRDNSKRRSIATQYLDLINNPKITLPTYSGKKDHVFHIFAVLTNDRKDLKIHLLENGIESMIHYPTPPHKQKAYQEYNHMKLPITEQIHKKILSIPINPILEQFEIDKIITTLNNY